LGLVFDQHFVAESAQISDKFAGSLADGVRIVASRSLFDETALSCSSFQMRRHMRWAIAQMTFLTTDGEPAFEILPESGCLWS
jgi:hypothetical protein